MNVLQLGAAWPDGLRERTVGNHEIKPLVKFPWDFYFLFFTIIFFPMGFLTNI